VIQGNIIHIFDGKFYCLIIW